MDKILIIVATIFCLIGAVMVAISIRQKRKLNNVETKDKKHILIAIIILVCAIISIVLNSVAIFK